MRRIQIKLMIRSSPACRDATLGEIGGEAHEVCFLQSAQEIDLAEVIDADSHGLTLACRDETVQGAHIANAIHGVSG